MVKFSAPTNEGISGRAASATIMPEPDNEWDSIKAFLDRTDFIEEVRIEMQDETPFQGGIPGEEYTECGMLMR